MPRLTITAGLISDLRQRVVHHNDMAKVVGLPLTKLQDLKKVYERSYRGQNPGERAMTAVDKHLESLGKAEDFDSTKHPRGKAGEFASKGGKDAARSISAMVPSDEASHQDLQSKSAGYRALTTEVVPENRFAFLGAKARVLGSAALGAGIAASVLRGRPNGVVRRFASWSGKKTGELAASGATAAVAHPAAAALRVVSAKARRDMPPSAVNDAVRRAGTWGGKKGEKIGAGAVGGATYASQAVMRAAGHGLSGDGQKTKRAFRRAAAFTGLAAVPTAAINSSIAGSGVDPEEIGRTYDITSYRTIQKVADPSDIALAHQAMVDILRKGIASEELEKAGGMFSRAGRAVFSSLAAAGGAAIGRSLASKAILRGAGAAAGAAAGAVAGAEEGNQVDGKRGNPYHDAKGRFTSHAAGVAGAVAGAALGGGAVLLAIKRHNLGAYRASSHALIERLRGGIKAASEGFESGPHADLFAKRHSLIQGELAKDKTHKKAIEALERHGGSATVHYQGKIKEEINGKIADILAGHDKLQLLTKDGKDKGARVWKSVGELTANAPSGTQGARARQLTLEALDRMSDSDFKEAVKDLPDHVRDAATHWFQKRTAEMSGVHQSIEGHLAAIDQAAAHVDATKADEFKAAEAMDRAHTILRASDDKSYEAAKGALDAATKAHAAARDAQLTANKAYHKLQSGGAPIKSPVTGKVIPAAKPADLELRKQSLTADAIDRAEKRVDKTIEEARQQHITHLVEMKNAELGAQAVLGFKHGSAPRDAKAATKALSTAHEAFRRQEGVLHTARDRLTDTAASLDALKKAQGKKLPKGMGAQKAQELKDDADWIEAHREDAQRDVAAAQSRLIKLRSDRADAARDYHDAMIADHEASQRPTVGRMPAWLANELKNDIHLVAEGTKSAAAALLRAPGAEALKSFAGKVKNTGWGAGKDVYRDLFMRKDEKTGDFVHSPAKILQQTGKAGAGLALFEGGREAVDYARAKLFGTDEEAAKVKFPSHFKVDNSIDPVTGKGFTAISVKDPENKGDHLLLWGQRYESADAEPKRLYAGGRMSLVRQRINEQNQGGGQRSLSSDSAAESAPLKDAPGLKSDVKTTVDTAVSKLKAAGKLRSAPAGPAGNVQFRDHNAHDQDQAVQSFVGHVRSLIKDGKQQDALRAIVSSQGRILANRQAYELLTGYQHNGDQAKIKKGALNENDGFKSQDPVDVAEALGQVIASNSKAVANDASLKTDLHRAVGLIGAAKNLPRNSVDSLHEAISPKAGGSSTQSAPKPENVASAPPRAQSSFVQETAHFPESWSHKALHDEADEASGELSSYDLLDLQDHHQHKQVVNTIKRLAQSVHTNFPEDDISEQDAVQVAASAVTRMAEGDDVHRRLARKAAISGDIDFFAPSLFDEARVMLDMRDSPLRRSAPLDDLDGMIAEFALKKSGDEAGTLLQRLPKAALEGTTETGTALAVREATRSKAQPNQSFFSTPRIAHELGSALAGDTAWRIAEGVAQRFIPGGAAVGSALQLATNPGVDRAAQAATRGLAGRAIGALRAAPGQIALAARAAPRKLAVQGTALVASSAANAGAGAGIDALTGVKYNPGDESANQATGRLVGSLAGDLTGYHYGGKIGGNLVARGVGAVSRSAVGRAAGSLVTRAAGALGARAIGGDIGAALGAFGGPVGSIVGGAAGSWLLGELGSRAADYFAGYDQNTVHRATKRVPRLGGGTNGASRAPGAGGHGGDPYHDQQGRFSSSGAA